MKKVLMIISTILLILLVSCKEEESNIVFKDKYEIGDVVEVDNIIYTYTNLSELGPFSFNDETPDSCYRYYYTDMSNTNQKEITGYDSNLFEDKKYSDISLSLEAYYYDFANVGEYDFYNDVMLVGFLVTGHNKDISDNVVIPTNLGKHNVIGIGMNAFNGSNIKTLEFESFNDIDNDYYRLIHPYAIRNCSNLEYINLGSNTLSLSMAISNCPKLKEISCLNAYFDCTLYNLENVEILTNFNNDTGIYRYNSYIFNNENIIYKTGLERVLAGLTKSVFYNCPKIKTVTNSNPDVNNNYFWVNDVLYYSPVSAYMEYPMAFWPIYVRNIEIEKQIIYLPLSNLENIIYYSCGVNVNKDEGIFYLPCINNGIDKTYYIYPIDFNSDDVLLEDNKITMTICHYPNRDVNLSESYRLSLYGNYEVIM